MKRVERSEIVDYVTYDEGREEFRRRVLAEKAPRRVHIGENLTLLFENALTVRYQIQEMLRAEKIVREADIQHELDTYNELLGGPGELGATLLVEIVDKEERARKLREWVALPEHVFLELGDGTRVHARADARQRSEDKLSAVQYLAFPLAGGQPVAAGVDLPGLELRVALDPQQQRALADDLDRGSE